VIYPLGYGSFIGGEWWAAGMQSVRIVLLVIATVLALAIVTRSVLKSPQSAAVESGA